MATPTCPKCDGKVFESHEIVIQNSPTPHSAIICANCGIILSINDSEFTAKLEQLAKSMNISFD